MAAPRGPSVSGGWLPCSPGQVLVSTGGTHKKPSRPEGREGQLPWFHPPCPRACARRVRRCAACRLRRTLARATLGRSTGRHPACLLAWANPGVRPAGSGAVFGGSRRRGLQPEAPSLCARRLPPTRPRHRDNANFADVASIYALVYDMPGSLSSHGGTAGVSKTLSESGPCSGRGPSPSRQRHLVEGGGPDDGVMPPGPPLLCNPCDDTA